MRTLGLALAVLFLGAGDAHARRESAFRYPYSLVWTTAVRMVRVDFESAITEKDRDEGYFLFEFPHEGKQHPGSVEVIRQTDASGVETARVVIQIPALPSYMEQMLLDRLVRKMSKEHGAPLQPKEPAAPSEEPKDGKGEEQPAPPEGDSAPHEKAAPQKKTGER